MTPCEERGYKVGDRFRVTGGVGYFGPFVPESIVELYRDDGSCVPKFKLISGHCNFNLCAEQPGAYTHIDSVEKIEMTETKQQKLERIERIEEELEALKRDVSKPERWESGVHIHLRIEEPSPADPGRVCRAAEVAAKVTKYVYDHAPDWDGDDPWGVWVWLSDGRWRAYGSTNLDLGAVPGPRWVMEKLAADLNTGRVVL